MDHPCVAVQTATTPEDLVAARTLLREYANHLAQDLAMDLAFLNFAHELDTLPGDYAAPRGCLLLAHVEGQLAGCCALRPLDNADTPNAAEMRRLYVRPAYRGVGLGRQLAEATLDAARQAGYSSVLLDTLDEMEAARNLYTDMGFTSVAPYYHNPLPGAHYLQVALF